MLSPFHETFSGESIPGQLQTFFAGVHIQANVCGGRGMKVIIEAIVTWIPHP